MQIPNIDSNQAPAHASMKGLSTPTKALALHRGLYVGLRLDGRVRASGAGAPPWQVMLLIEYSVMSCIVMKCAAMQCNVV